MRGRHRPAVTAALSTEIGVDNKGSTYIERSVREKGVRVRNQERKVDESERRKKGADLPRP